MPYGSRLAQDTYRKILAANARAEASRAAAGSTPSVTMATFINNHCAKAMIMDAGHSPQTGGERGGKRFEKNLGEFRGETSSPQE